MRTVLITGANRGLGFELAKELLKKNFRVIMTARDTKKLEQAHKSLNCPYPFFSLNVTNQRTILDLVQHLRESKTAVDVLVNNAAVLETQLSQQQQLAKQVMDVNYYGVVNVSNALLPLLSDDAKVKGLKINKILILTSNLGKLSLQGKYVQNLLNSHINEVYLDKIVQQFIKDHDLSKSFGHWNPQFKPIYSASKALINAYARHVLSKKVHDNQSVFSVHPGWLKTDMGGKAAPQEVDEGIYTCMELIMKPFGRDPSLHGHYFNENAKIENY